MSVDEGGPKRKRCRTSEGVHVMGEELLIVVLADMW